MLLDLSRSGPSKSTLLAGTSGSGKSVLLRAAIMRGIDLGYKYIILETKSGDPADFLPWYPEIEPYISQSSDPDTIAALLKSDRNDLSILIDVCDEGDTWEQIYTKLEKEMNNQKRHPLERKDAKMVHHFLGNLIEEMKTIKKIRNNLHDIPLVSVMDLRKLSENMQKLIAGSTAQWILNFAEDTIFIVDEYHKQGHNKMLEAYAAEGRSKGDFLIASDQNITKIPSDMRQNFQEWIFFRQNDRVKAQRVADQVIGLNIKFKDAMNLKTGECYVNDYNEGTSEKIFVWGDWYSREDAIKVARGIISYKDVGKVPPPPAKIPLKPREEDWSDVMSVVVAVRELIRI